MWECDSSLRQRGGCLFLRENYITSRVLQALLRLVLMRTKIL